MTFNLTSAQAAAILHCSERTIQKLVKAGKLRGTKIGNGTKRERFTFAPDEIEAYRMQPIVAAAKRAEKILFSAPMSFDPVPTSLAAKVARKQAQLRLAGVQC